MNVRHNTNNLDGVQNEEDHQTTEHENNNICVARTQVEEDH